METALRLEQFACGRRYELIGSAFFAHAARDVDEGNRPLSSPKCVLEGLGRNTG
jgi:hypothetical protein